MENNVFDKFNNYWALVTCGTMDKFNAMTISWGGMGILWNRKVITIYVKKSRYTLSFLKENDYFTVSFYDEKHRDALAKLGSLSGRDIDKIKEVNFHPIKINESITFNEAHETYVCHKIYLKKMEYEDVPEFTKPRYESIDNTHYIIIGEIVDYQNNKSI